MHFAGGKAQIKKGTTIIAEETRLGCTKGVSLGDVID
jgi:hypothetical protein